MASESTVQRNVWLALARRAVARVTLFRLNTGRAWLSSLGPKGVIKMADGSVLIKAARSIALGFADPTGNPLVGAADLNGWTTITITPEMVGRNVAVYTGIETKETGGGQKRAAQIIFAKQVHAAGGIAGFASSVQQANEIIDAWLRGESPNPL